MISHDSPENVDRLVSYDTQGNPLHPSPYGRGSASEITGYGSYSGVDCKVVVHIPRNMSLVKEKQKQKIILERDLAQAQNQLNTIRSVGNIQGTELERSVLTKRSQIESVQRELVNIDQDINEIMSLPTTVPLTEISNLSWSVYREKVPKRPLGSTYPKTFTRGPRTISGTMVLVNFNRNAFHYLANMKMKNTGVGDYDRYAETTNLNDQLPPIDVSLIFANEYGSVSYMGIYGLEFFMEGGTFSVEDIFSEIQIQYYARDIDLMRPIDQRKVDAGGVSEQWDETASSMLTKKQGLKTRRNPFI